MRCDTEGEKDEVEEDRLSQLRCLARKSWVCGFEARVALVGLQVGAMRASRDLIGRPRGVSWGVDQQQGGCGATAPESREKCGKRGRARVTEQSLHDGGSC